MLRDDDLEVVSLCRDVAAASTLFLRTGSPVFVGMEAVSGVPVKQVTEEIVDYVGQWEKIVDAPVPLRSLDADLGVGFFKSLSRLLKCSRCFRSS